MIGVEWQGPDGSIWNLRDGSRGVQIAQGSLLGLRNPPLKAFTRESSFVDGQTFTGYKFEPRPIDLPLDIHGNSEGDWFTRERTLARAFRVDRPGKLTITDPFGGRRTITARLDDTDDDGLDEDPAAMQGSVLTIPLIADDPYYYGEPLDHEFKNATPGRGFYPPSGFGPPFYLAPSAFTGADTLDNPGDVPAWGVLTIPGPCSGFTVNIGGRRIEGFADGYSIPSGRTLTLDMDPRRSSAKLDDGTNITRKLTSTQFAAIPDGASVPIDVIVIGDTIATMTLTPRYLRAW